MEIDQDTLIKKSTFEIVPKYFNTHLPEVWL